MGILKQSGPHQALGCRHFKNNNYFATITIIGTVSTAIVAQFLPSFPDFTEFSHHLDPQ